MHDNRPKMTIKEFQEAAINVFEPNRIPVILWGPTGVGKTDVLVRLAEQTNRILRIFYPAGMEASDLSGLPFQSSKNVELVEFRKTDLIHFDKDKKYILFFDELNRAAIDMQQATIPMWNHTPYFGVHKLEADVWIVTAMNDSALQEGVMVSECDDALLTRSAQIVLTPTVRETGAYLTEKYPANLMAGFLMSNYIADAIKPDFSDVYSERTYIMPTPRNFEKACQMVRNIDSDQLKESNAMRLALQSILGTKVTGAFQAYLRELEKLNPELLFGDSKEIKKRIKQCCENIDQQNTTMLLNAFQAAASMLKDKEPEELRHFVRNMLAIEKDDSGSNAYSEIVASVYAKVRTDSPKNIMSVLAEDEFISPFLKYANKKK